MELECTGKKDNNYIVEVYVNNEIGEDKSAYIIQMLLKPDFSVKFWKIPWK